MICGFTKEPLDDPSFAALLDVGPGREFEFLSWNPKPDLRGKLGGLSWHSVTKSALLGARACVRACAGAGGGRAAAGAASSTPAGSQAAGRPAGRPQAFRPEVRGHFDSKSAGIGHFRSQLATLRRVSPTSVSTLAPSPEQVRSVGARPTAARIGLILRGAVRWCGRFCPRAALDRPRRCRGRVGVGFGATPSRMTAARDPGVTRETRHPRAWVAGRAHPGANGRQRQCPCDYRYASARLAGEFREPVMYEDTSGVWRHAVIHDVWRHAVIYDDRRQPCQRLCGT